MLISLEYSLNLLTLLASVGLMLLNMNAMARTAKRTTVVGFICKDRQTHCQ